MGRLVADKYEPMRRLGAGGMAEVHLARQRGAYGFERYVVLKRLLPHLARRDEFVEMFLDEARIAADLRHVNVVSTLDIGEDDDGLYLVLEYLEGCTARELQAWARRRGQPLEPGHALRICGDAARGLAYAHDKRDAGGRPLEIVHRDVSPENLFVGRDGVCRVLDFGIAKASLSLAETSVGQLKGKFAYMSPEQARGEPATAAADQFALGLVLYELLSGRRAYDQNTEAELFDAATHARFDPRLGVGDGSLVAVVERATETRPEDRFASAAELAAAVDALAPTFPPARPLGGVVGEAIRSAHDGGGEATAATGAIEAIATPGGAHLSMATASLVGLERNNLPDELSSFVGRRAELDELDDVWSGGARAITLVGTGGIGKTRLAVQFAHRLAMTAHPEGGIWFCELVNAADVDAICQEIAAPLRVSLDGSADDVVGQLGRALAVRGPTLLILDNAEHVVDTTRRAARAWLRAAPQLRLVVTSRERLGLDAERVLELGPLAGRAGALDEAVELFYQRARQSAPRRRLGDEHRALVERIVTRLDGIPLAVELAAARLRVLSLEQLHERLDRALDLLKQRHRSAERHTALRGALDWSWDLLDHFEQAALRQCSVFRGGFDIEAAEAVIELDDAGAAAPLAIDLVEALREKSLLRERLVDEDLRFDLYETIRSYAAEKLEAAGETAATRRRHADHYLGVCAPAWEEARRDRTPSSIAPLGLEAENLIAVYRLGLDSGDPELIARAVVLLEPVMWRGATPRATYLERLTRAIEADADPATTALCLMHRGARRGLQFGDAAGGLADLDRALAIAAELDDPALRARIHGKRAYVRTVDYRFEPAAAELGVAVEIAGGLGDRFIDVELLGTECDLRFRRRDAVEDTARRGLALAREAGWKYWQQRFLMYWQAASPHGPESRKILEEALALDPEDLSCRYNYGCALNIQGDYAAARRAFERTLKLALAQNHERAQGITRLDLALLNARDGEVDAARRTLAAADDIRGGAWLHAWVAVMRAIVEASAGAADDAERWLERGLERSSDLDDPELEQVIAIVRGEIHLARGEIEEARAVLDASEDTNEDWTTLVRRWFRERLEAAETTGKA